MFETSFTILDGFLIFSLFALLVWYIEATHKRVKIVHNKLARLSFTFLKIENDLDTTNRALQIILTSHFKDDEAVEYLAKREAENLEFMYEEAFRVEHIMRGLELPDLDDDPNFWNGNYLDKLLGRKLDTKEY